ncbi:MAG TPA: hypothetical protein VIF62_01225 [Labilithrix sp.]
MARSLVLARWLLLAVGIVACSAAPKSKNDLLTSNDTKKGAAAAGEGDDSATSPEPSGQASAPQPDDDSSPPHRDGGAGADGGSDPPPPPPPPPADAGDGPLCYSATLMDYEPEGVCVQSASTMLWYQCHDTMWYQGVVDDQGPYGPCTISYPLF